MFKHIKKGFIILSMLFFWQIYAQDGLDSLIIDTTEVFPVRNFEQLSEKYKGHDFDYSEKQIKELNIWEKFKKWLHEKISELFRIKNPLLTEKIIVNVFRWAGIGLILFVIYKIVRAMIDDEGSWIFGKTAEKLDITAFEIDKNLLDADLNQLILEAIHNKQYRLAIRYHYLLTLKKLNEKGHITWHYEKTNQDYAKELKNTAFINQFRYVSYLYDYCWYGAFDIDQTTYNKGASYFKEFYKTL